MVKKLLLTGIFIIFTGISVNAEMSTSVKLTLLNTLARIDEDYWSFSGLGTGRLTFKAEKNKNVKAQLSLDAQIADSAIFDISRAFIKVRFPGFRTTLGKARVSWGEGFFYNAGDVIFGASAPSPDMTAEELRDETAWLTSVYVPLGTYSFLETILLAPELNLSELTDNPDAKAGHIRDTQAGGRFVTRIQGIKTEGGYLYSGIDAAHKPYLSFQGHLLIDWHLCASVSIPGESPHISDLRETLNLSWGLFHMQTFLHGSSLFFRLEGLVIPDASWSEKNSSTEDAEYALMLYPEISWSATDSLSLILRNIVSPIDRSVLITAGIHWNIYEGFKIFGFLTRQAGETTDIYGWNKPGGIGATAGFQFTY